MRNAWIVLVASLLLHACGGSGEGPDAGVAALDPEVTEQLAALGYADWVEGEDDLSRSGVTHRAPDAVVGLTLYKSRRLPEAHLIDLDGNVVHTWEAPRVDVNDWESFISLFRHRGPDVTWDHVEVLPGGALLAIVQDRHIEKLDWDSRLVWRTRIRAHHDVGVAPDGRLITLTRDFGEYAAPDGPLQIVDNFIAVLSPDGELLREMSLAPLLGDRIDPGRIARIRELEARGEGSLDETTELRDVFHANGLEVLDRDVPGLGRAGQVLVSIRFLDLLALVDLDARAIVWEWGPGELECQHHPAVLANGHVTIFDNGSRRRWSRALELDPRSRRIVWEYRTDPPGKFFSNLRGSTQWLPGDHFLIAEADRGRAIEIDRQGRIVWEFLNPDLKHHKTKRGAFYRIERLPPAMLATLPLGQDARADVAALPRGL